MTKRLSIVAAAAVLAIVPAALIAGRSGRAGAAFPGANGRIAFAGKHGIYVTSSKRNGIVKHLAGDRRTRPAWSPNGHRIAFERYGKNGSDIYKMKANGKGEVLLTRGGASGFSPTWAPSGEKLAFVRTRAAGEAIFKMRANGADKRRVTPKDGSFADSPSWSPDGNRIAYVCEFAHRGAQICTIRSDGSRRRVLTDFKEKSPSRPDFSPDGRRIAFAAGRNRAGSLLHFHLYVMDADGGHRDRITPKHGHSSLLPSWSPDGTKIAFLRVGRGIMKMRPDGSNPQLIVPDATYPAWQPK
ncbi:MAG: hypothetical protein U0R51_03610 [Solirubrobacterales bacterium]